MSTTVQHYKVVSKKNIKYLFPLMFTCQSSWDWSRANQNPFPIQNGNPQQTGEEKEI